MPRYVPFFGLLLGLIALSACDSVAPATGADLPDGPAYSIPFDSLCAFQALPQPVDVGVAATFHANFLVFPERNQVTGNAFLQTLEGLPDVVKWDFMQEETVCAEGQVAALQLTAVERSTPAGGPPAEAEVTVTIELPEGDSGEVPFRLLFGKYSGVVEGVADLQGFEFACE